jgi:parallel beta-helix repeat protein
MKKYLSVVIILLIAVAATAYVRYVSQTPTSPHNVQAEGNTYYVATNGSDSNPGSQSQPFGTIKKGIETLSAGNTLYLRGGTYNEYVAPDGGIRIPSGTSWSNAVTIAGYPGETAAIANGVNIQENVDGSTVSYVIFDNLKMQTFRVAGNSHHIRLSNSELSEDPSTYIAKLQAGEFEPYANPPQYIPESVCGAGCALHNLIMMTSTTNSIEIIHNRVHDGFYGFYANSSNSLIEGNEVYGNMGYGLHLYHSGGSDVNNNIVRNNTFHHNGFYDWRKYKDSGFIMASGSNNVAYNNIVYGNAHGISVAYGCTNCQVYNNTVYGNQLEGISMTSANSTIVKNNIIYGNGGTIVDWDNGSGGLVQSNNLTTDPNFVNAAAGDFHLQQGSPVIDAGMTLSQVTTDADGKARPAGSAYDIGAYEYGATGGSPMLSSIPQPSIAVSPLPTPPYVTPTIYCLGACPTLPPTPTPINQADNPGSGEEIQEPPTEEEPPSGETIETPGEDTGEENTPPEEAPSEGQPELSGEQTGSDGLQQLLSFIMRLIQAILKLFLFHI